VLILPGPLAGSDAATGSFLELAGPVVVMFVLPITRRRSEPTLLEGRVPVRLLLDPPSVGQAGQDQQGDPTGAWADLPCSMDEPRYCSSNTGYMDQEPSRLSLGRRCCWVGPRTFTCRCLDAVGSKCLVINTSAPVQVGERERSGVMT